MVRTPQATVPQPCPTRSRSGRRISRISVKTSLPSFMPAKVRSWTCSTASWSRARLRSISWRPTMGRDPVTSIEGARPRTVRMAAR